MLDDCTQYVQSILKTANAVEAVLAAGNIHCRNVYVAQRTFYGLIFLYGADCADFGADHRYLQFMLYSAGAPRISDDVPGRHIDDGPADEFLPAAAAAKLYLAVRALVLPVL